MLFEESSASKSGMKFTVNSTGVMADLFAKRFAVEGMVRNNPERRKALEEMEIIGTPLDTEIVSTIAQSGGVIKKYMLTGSGKNIYDTISRLSHNKPENFKDAMASKVVYMYDCPEDSVDEICSLVPDCQEVLKTESGKRMIRRTIEYKNRIENLWGRCEHNLDRYTNQVIGEANLAPNGKKILVSVMAPIYNNERNSSEEKDKSIFYYSQSEARSREEQNHNRAYTIASLFHEKIHETVLPYKLYMTKKQKDRFHAFIKFFANKEVYHMITGKSYLDIETPREDQELMAKVYPFWLGYLHRKDTDPVGQIQADINRDRKAFNRLNKNSKKRKTYEKYDFKNLSAVKIAQFFVGKKGMSPYEFADIDFDNRSLVEYDKKIDKVEKV